jgi:hypothetical protein
MPGSSGSNDAGADWTYLGNDLIRYLPRNRFAFLFWNVIHRKDIGVFLVQRQRINMDDLFFSDECLEYPSMALQETAIDHDAMVRILNTTLSDSLIGRRPPSGPGRILALADSRPTT